MKTLRPALFGVLAVYLVGGYAMSQIAYLQGQPGEWAAKIDTPPVALVSLILFVGCLALYFIPEKEEPSQT